MAELPNADWTLAMVLQSYESSLDSKARKTRLTRKSIIKKFRATWSHGFELPIAKITPLMLRLWLTQHRGRLRAVSYNEYVRFIRQLFDIALEAKAIAESPAKGLKLLKPETPKRLTPTWDQFQAIVQGAVYDAAEVVSVRANDAERNWPWLFSFGLVALNANKLKHVLTTAAHCGFLYAFPH